MGENYDQYPNQFVVALTGLLGCALDDHKHPEDGATYRENQEEEEADHIADCTLRPMRLGKERIPSSAGGASLGWWAHTLALPHRESLLFSIGIPSPLLACKIQKTKG